MARRNFGRSRRGASPTRMLEWGVNASVDVANAAASVVTRSVLLDGVAAGHGLKQTIFRIVGMIHLTGQTLGLNQMFHMGVYLQEQDTAGSFNLLDPGTPADVAVDSWLWYTSRFVRVADIGGASPESESIGVDSAANIPVDIKVKRIVGNNQRIELAYVGTQAYTFGHSLRILSKVTGTH